MVNYFGKLDDKVGIIDKFNGKARYQKHVVTYFSLITE